MKKKFITIIFCLIAVNANAQLNHYITINYAPYTNYFNQMDDRFFRKRAYERESHWINALNQVPRLEYRVLKSKIGLSTYFTYDIMQYKKLDYGFAKANDVVEISHWLIGINFHYKILAASRVEIQPFLGVNYGGYHALSLIQWFSNPPWHEPIVKQEEGNTLGFQTGTNFTANIWKGLFASTNLRYTINPFTKHDLFRHNLMWELGIGYRIQGRKK